MYPQNQDQAEKFAIGAMKLMHDDTTRDGIMDMLLDERAPVEVRLATIAASIINAMLQKVAEQAKQPPSFDLLVHALKMVINELALMAKIGRLEISVEQKAKAGKLAGDMVEKQLQGGGQQQQPQQPQQAPQQQMPQQPPQQPQGLLAGGVR